MSECHDCERPYGDPGFPDMLVPDEVWRKISPTGDGGGLLCPSCICARTHALGIEEVPHAFTSGPFRIEWGPYSWQRPPRPRRRGEMWYVVGWAQVAVSLVEWNAAKFWEAPWASVEDATYLMVAAAVCFIVGTYDP